MEDVQGSGARASVVAKDQEHAQRGQQVGAVSSRQEPFEAS